MTYKNEHGLTPQQERFCQELAKGMTQADAYRTAYPKSMSWKDKSVWEKASTLMGAVKVQSRVQTLRAVAAAKSETESEWIRRRLKEEANDFSEFSSHSARVRALEILCRIHGEFEKDNRQQAAPLVQLALILRPDIAGPGAFAIPEDADSEG